MLSFVNKSKISHGFVGAAILRWSMACLALTTILIQASPFCAAKDPKGHYGVVHDPKAYPQSSPKETLQSLIKAVEAKNPGYVLAYLADPEWVDGRVKEYGQKFEVLLKETTGKLIDDPSALKLLKRFEKEGSWEADEFKARVKLKDVSDKSIQFRKIGDTWYMENEYKAKGK
jgi:hypothetical protein